MLEENKIKRFLRNLASGILAYLLILSGAVARARKQSQQPGKILSIFFHNPPYQLFRKCMRWLVKHGFHFVSTDDVTSFLLHQKPLPAGSVWVTFDDGWKDNLHNVLPVLEEYKIPVTIFIPTGEIERGGFWFCQAIAHKDKLPATYREHPFESLLAVPNARRMELTRDLYPATSAEYILNIEELVKLAKHPLVTLGSHTVNHVVTVHCTETELDEELGKSKEMLEHWTGTPVTSFAYPNGDHDGREAPCLRKYGYQLAATIEEGLIDAQSGPLFLPRNCVLDDGSFAENLCHMLGVWTPFINGLKRLAGKAPQRSTSSTKP